MLKLLNKKLMNGPHVREITRSEVVKINSAIDHGIRTGDSCVPYRHRPKFKINSYGEAVIKEFLLTWHIHQVNRIDLWVNEAESNLIPKVCIDAFYSKDGELKELTLNEKCYYWVVGNKAWKYWKMHDLMNNHD